MTSYDHGYDYAYDQTCPEKVGSHIVGYDPWEFPKYGVQAKFSESERMWEARSNQLPFHYNVQ